MPLMFRPPAFLERKPPNRALLDRRTVAAEQETGDMVVEGEVFEVVEAFTLAHLRTADGQVYGINRRTPGVKDFQSLREGQRYRCEVTRKFNRVLRAELIA